MSCDWCGEMGKARAAIKWLIENDASWTVDDDIPEECRAIIAEVRDEMYGSVGDGEVK